MDPELKEAHQSLYTSGMCMGMSGRFLGNHPNKAARATLEERADRQTILQSQTLDRHAKGHKAMRSTKIDEAEELETMES